MQVPTLSSNVNEVTLDLVVKDKKHKPVLDLKPEDFVVTDNDVPVKLTAFRLVNGNARIRPARNPGLRPFHGSDSKDRAGNCAENPQNASLKRLFLFGFGYSWALASDSGLH